MDAAADLDFGIGYSASTPISNTICVSDPKDWSTVRVDVVEQLSEYGEIARLDSSLGTILKCVLVTYFDVRAAQKALKELPCSTEPFPQADHDFRIVLVRTAAYAAKVGVVGGFNQFGEVANISMHNGDAYVEYYDMRCAQRLCALAGGCAAPFMPRQQGGGPFGSQISSAPGLGSAAGGHGACLGGQLGALANSLGALASLSGLPKTSGREDAMLAIHDVNMPSAFVDEASPLTNVNAVGGLPVTNRPVRTKISNKDFSKYDIHPEAILRGEDPRTTVMVRNLVGPKARKDFLKFLEKCGLQNRYTFFYMPCKEHRDVRAGFAFVNFRSAEDVQLLYAALNCDMWQEMRKGDPQCKPLAMSYARFQGHDELVSHFSSSVVLHEQDPEKRPIFCPDASTLGFTFAAPVAAGKQWASREHEGTMSMQDHGGAAAAVAAAAVGAVAAAAAATFGGPRALQQQQQPQQPQQHQQHQQQQQQHQHQHQQHQQHQQHRNGGDVKAFGAAPYQSSPLSLGGHSNFDSNFDSSLELQAAFARGVSEITAILAGDRRSLGKDPYIPAYVPMSVGLDRLHQGGGPHGSIYPRTMGM